MMFVYCTCACGVAMLVGQAGVHLDFFILIKIKQKVVAGEEGLAKEV